MTTGEVVALRRIALLVTRASEDCDPIRDDLEKIATVIDEMKKSLVLGAPLDKNIARLSSLIRRLPDDARCKTSSCKRLRASLVDELRELLPAVSN
jgi:hypothetical protein